MGQSSKEFSAKLIGGVLRWRVVGLYKEGITMKRGGVIGEGRKKEEHIVWR